MRPVVRDRADVTARPIVAGRSAVELTGRACEPVVHSYAAVAFYTGGRGRMELAGEWSLTEGDVLLVPPGAPHRALEANGLELWGVSFCVPCFAAEEAGALLVPFERVRDGASPVVSIPASRRAFLASLFEELARDEVLGDGAARVLHVPGSVERSLLTLILAEVERACGSAAPRPSPGVAMEALRFIERNCLGPLTLVDVAAAVGKSPTYVTTALKRATGKSVVQWIVSARMAEARRLLVHSDEMVDVVAERVGYADATHFIRMFRREHGATPAAWRAAQTRERSSSSGSSRRTQRTRPT